MNLEFLHYPHQHSAKSFLFVSSVQMTYVIHKINIMTGQGIKKPKLYLAPASSKVTATILQCQLSKNCKANLKYCINLTQIQLLQFVDIDFVTISKKQQEPNHLQYSYIHSVQEKRGHSIYTCTRTRLFL